MSLDYPKLLDWKSPKNRPRSQVLMIRKKRESREVTRIYFIVPETVQVSVSRLRLVRSVRMEASALECRQST